MLSQHSHTLRVATGGRQFHDLTRELETLVEQAGFTTGLATLHRSRTFHGARLPRRRSDV